MLRNRTAWLARTCGESSYFPLCPFPHDFLFPSLGSSHNLSQTPVFICLVFHQPISFPYPWQTVLEKRLPTRLNGWAQHWAQLHGAKVSATGWPTGMEAGHFWPCFLLSFTPTSQPTFIWPPPSSSPPSLSLAASPQEKSAQTVGLVVALGRAAQGLAQLCDGCCWTRSSYACCEFLEVTTQPVLSKSSSKDITVGGMGGPLPGLFQPPSPLFFPPPPPWHCFTKKPRLGSLGNIVVVP